MYFAHSSVNSLHENLGPYLLCNLKPCLASAWWELLLKRLEVLTRSPPPIPVPFSMSYPPDWYYQMHYTAVNSPWKWLGPFGGADVFQSPISLAVSKASEPLFSFSSSSSSSSSSFFFRSSKGLAAAERLGGRGGAEGGGGGCNWRLEPCYPSRCPHQPISILSLLFNPGDPLGRQGLWHVFEYGLRECEKVFSCCSAQCLGLSPRPCFVTDMTPASDSHIQAWHVLSPSH